MKTRLPTTTRPTQILYTSYLCALLLFGLTGCAEEQESLHELDHFVPVHWPHNLQHASELIVARIATAQHAESAKKELDELLSWVPEIAADTELSEQDWLPIFIECERLRRNLQGDIDDALRADLQQMASTLKAAHERLKELLPRGWTDPSTDLDIEQQDNQNSNDELGV